MGLIQGSEGLRTTMGPAATDQNGFSTEVSFLFYVGGEYTSPSQCIKCYHAGSDRQTQSILAITFNLRIMKNNYPSR